MIKTLAVAAALSAAVACGHDAPPPSNQPPPSNPPPPVTPAGPDRACLAGTWTQGPTPEAQRSPPAPNGCVTCPDTTYELTAQTATGFTVEERGIVHRKGLVRYEGDSIVLELFDDAGVVVSRAACKTEVACTSLRCAWLVGGAGEAMLTK